MDAPAGPELAKADGSTRGSELESHNTSASTSKADLQRADEYPPLAASSASSGIVHQTLDYEERESTPEDAIISDLPAVDGGWGAWSYLAAATALEVS